MNAQVGPMFLLGEDRPEVGHLKFCTNILHTATAAGGRGMGPIGVAFFFFFF